MRQNLPKKSIDIRDEALTEREETKKRQSSNKFADEVCFVLHKYSIIYTTLDPFFLHLRNLIFAMDAYHVELYTTLLHTKATFEQQKLVQQDIYTIMNDIGEELHTFEYTFLDTKEQATTIITLLTAKTNDNTREFSNKLDSAHDLYKQIYQNIEEVYIEYEQLLRKSQRK